MPHGLIQFLFILFLLHLLAFARLAVLRREGYYFMLSFVFLLLVASFATWLWLPELRLGSFPVYRILRYLAWLAAAISISWGLRRKFGHRRPVSRRE